MGPVVPAAAKEHLFPTMGLGVVSTGNSKKCPLKPRFCVAKVSQLQKSLVGVPDLKEGLHEAGLSLNRNNEIQSVAFHGCRAIVE